MPDQNWKKWERQVCKDCGGERDWEHPEECRDTGIWAPEAKYRKKIPTWLHSMMKQAESQARDDQIPFVALTEHGKRRNDAFVIMRYSDFMYWFVEEVIDEQLDDEAVTPSLDNEYDPFNP